MRPTPTILSLVCLAPVSAAQVQLFKLTASDGEQADSLGRSVDISGDRAIAGTSSDDGRGSAYVFDVPTGLELFEIVASDGEDHDFFGWSIAISGDRAVVGAWGDDDHGPMSGSAYLFDVTTGQELFKLTASDASVNDQFGRCVAIHGDRAVVGAYWNDELGMDAGAAYVFDVATGQELFKLTASDGGFDDHFGSSVALDGERIVVGAISDDDAGFNAGSAYVFDLATGQELFKLVASNPEPEDFFGESVAVQGDRVVVGAGYDDHLEQDAGSAYVFDATTGAELLELRAADGKSSDRFGSSVALQGDRLLVGAHGDDDGGTNAGSVYLFDVTTGQQLAEFFPSDAQYSDVFGESVAIDGERAIVGSHGDDDHGSLSGAAYLFGFSDPIGTRYCTPAVANSTGLAAEIVAAGSDAAGDNDVYLAAVQMPKKQFGYFLNGPTQGFVANPGGSQGNLCLGGTIGRHVDDVFSTGKTGTGSLVLDLASIPFPGGGHTILAGETWNWTAWYRDENPEKTSNFTDGVSVLFQ